MTIESRPPHFDEVVRELRRHSTEAGDVWRGFLAAGLTLSGGRDGVVFRRDGAGGGLETIAWAPNGAANPAPATATN